MAESVAAGGSKIESHVWRIAAVVVLGTIMSVLDTTIVNVALDTLGRDLHATVDQIQWVATGYLLALAAVIPVSGWASRRFSSRSVYIVSLVMFTAGSVLCGLADSVGSLVFFRVIQGIGGGMLVPTGQMILVKAAGPKNLPKVMSAIGVPIVLAPIFGPTIGGLLLEHVSWQSIFLVNLPVGIITLVAALKLLPKDKPEGAEKLDFLGLGLLSVGLVGVTYGLAETGSAGTLIAASVLVPLAIGLVGIASFAVRALRIPNPLLNVRLYKNRAFTAASITTFCLGAALFGAMVLMPLYFQTVRGEDAVTTGLLLIPQGLGAAVAMALSGRATERWGGGITATIGTADHAGRDDPLRPARRQHRVRADRRGDGDPRLRHRDVDHARDDRRLRRPDPAAGDPRDAAADHAAAGRRLDGHGDPHRRPAGAPGNGGRLAERDGERLRHHLHLGDGHHRGGAAADPDAGPDRAAGAARKADPTPAKPRLPEPETRELAWESA